MSDLLLMGAGSVQTAAAAANFGYFAGGTTGANVATNDRLDFSADTTAMVTKGALFQARSGLASFNSSTVGYWSGGHTGAAVNTADGLTFSTDTTTMTTRGALSTTAFRTAAANSSTLGYTNIGNDGSATVTTTNGLTFSTDTTAQVTKGALTVALESMGACNSSTLGYWAGGAPITTTNNGLTFSTDTTAMVTKGALVTLRFWTSAANSSTLGYWSGGYTNSAGTLDTATTDGLTFSTDTTAMVTKGALAAAREEMGAANSSSKGYWAGGFTGAGGGRVTTCESLTFSTDTTAMVTAGALTQARNQVAGCQTTGV